MTARVLLADIETAPITAHVWGLRDQNIGLNQVIEGDRMIGFGAKWYDRPKSTVKFYSEYHNTADEMVERAHELLDLADIVVHFNGKRFDTPWFNTEFARRGMKPPSPFKQIDLYQVVRKNFRFPSYKLAHVSKFFLNDTKVAHTGHQMWVDCLLGDEETRRKAWNLMAKYCKQDVALLGPLLDELRPWVGTAFPNLALYGQGSARPSCPACGSENLQARGWAVSTTRRYRRFQCQVCGSWTRDTAADKDVQAKSQAVVR